MTQPLSNTQMRDVEALLHPYNDAVEHRKNGAHVISRGDGIRVFDDTGKGFIDGLAGLWCCGLGFSDPELIEAAKAQYDRLPSYHVFGPKSHEPAIELAEKIKELAPGNMARVMFQCSGSEANDTQIKLAWYYNNARGMPKKKKIISRQRAYHGVTLAAASLTGLPNNHRDFDLPMAGVHHIGTPHFWRYGEQGESEAAFTTRLVAELEALIEREGPETIAAFIAEPVMGAGGVMIPPAGYFPALVKVLQKHDIAMIDDEVICGFGRTGEWFGAQALGMTPTSISMAKQLTGGYAPLSAVALNREMVEVIEENSGKIGTLGHGYTYGAHPVSCAVGLKAIEIYQRRDILGHVNTLAPLLAAHLARIEGHPLVGNTRSLGLIGGIELAPEGAKEMPVPGKVGPRLAMELASRGVILRAMGDTLGVCPPMIITEAEMDEMFAPMEASLDATHHWAKKEGILG